MSLKVIMTKKICSYVIMSLNSYYVKARKGKVL